MSINYEGARKKLLARKEELEVVLQRLAENRALLESEQAQDPLDQAVNSGIEDLNIVLEENEREELIRILDALKMLDQGRYGRCHDCEEPISEKRLELYPNAFRCIGCQEKHESLA